MRLPRFRLKLWMLVLAVAIIGTLIGAENLRRRSVAFHEKAQYFAGEEANWANLVAETEKIIGNDEPQDAAEAAAVRPYVRYNEGIRDLSAYCAAMKLKYQRAAHRPWISIPADPPCPPLPPVPWEAPGTPPKLEEFVIPQPGVPGRPE